MVTGRGRKPLSKRPRGGVATFVNKGQRKRLAERSPKWGKNLLISGVRRGRKRGRRGDGGDRKGLG